MTEKKPSAFQMSLGARLRTYFFAGVLITAPVSLTVYLAWLFITLVDEVFSLLPPEYNPETICLDPQIGPAAGAGRPDADRRTDRRHHRSAAQRSRSEGAPQPAAGDPSLYGDQADHGNGAANKSSAFRECVLIEYPRKGIWTLGLRNEQG
jgi:hypothetical protein